MIIAWLTVALAALAVGCHQAPGPGSPPPEDGVEEARNVVLIIADDMGPYLGAYGEKRIETPHMDALAASGTRFDRAYVTQASCSPSRTSILTGLYPHTSGQMGVTATGYALHAKYQDSTLPALLQQQGVFTGFVGKLHVQPVSAYPFDRLWEAKEATRDVRVVADWVGDFLRDAGSRRFFLVVSLYDPHAADADAEGQRTIPAQVHGIPSSPLSPGPGTLLDFQGFDDQEARQRAANYLSAIERVDAGVGLVMKQLADAGLYEDTAVVVVGDHGPPFARAKATNYEAGVRVPLIARWPGAAPQVSPALVSTVDLTPTILETFQVEVPAHVQGQSLTRLLQGKVETVREALATEFTFHNSGNFFPRRALTDGRWKLIHNLLWASEHPDRSIDGDRIARRIAESPSAPREVKRAFARAFHPPEYELYDLERDPFERHNLASKAGAADDLSRLQSLLKDWQVETKDPALDRAWLDELAASGAPAKR